MFLISRRTPYRQFLDHVPSRRVAVQLNGSLCCAVDVRLMSSQVRSLPVYVSIIQRGRTTALARGKSKSAILTTLQSISIQSKVFLRVGSSCASLFAVSLPIIPRWWLENAFLDISHHLPDGLEVPGKASHTRLHVQEYATNRWDWCALE